MEGQNGYTISGSELFFFNEKPAALPLYGAFAQRLFTEIDNVIIKVQKTQIYMRCRPHGGTRHGIPDVQAQRHRIPAWC